VKSIRTHLHNMFEVRMLVTAPSKGNWYTPDASRIKEGMGGYEIRKKDWKIGEAVLKDCTEQQWDTRSIYVVRPLRCTSSNIEPGLPGKLSFAVQNCAWHTCN
jgi:hypothetical protein